MDSVGEGEGGKIWEKATECKGTERRVMDGKGED